jgi:hypothetical protein
MQLRCDGVKVDAVEVIELMKMDCSLWNRTIFFTILSFFLPFSHDISFTSNLGY